AERAQQQAQQAAEETERRLKAVLQEADRQLGAERQRTAGHQRSAEQLEAVRLQLHTSLAEAERRLQAEQETTAAARRRAEEQMALLRRQSEQERAALQQELAQLRETAGRAEVGYDRRHEAARVDAFWAQEANRAAGRPVSLGSEFMPRPAANPPRASGD